MLPARSAEALLLLEDGSALVSRGTYVTTSTPTAMTSMYGRTARATSSTGLPNRYEAKNKFIPTSGVK